MSTSNSVHRTQACHRRQWKADNVLALMCIMIVMVLLPNSSPIGVQASQHSAPPNHKKKLLAANWKGSLETTQEVDDLIDTLNHMWRSQTSHDEKNLVELCVHPPYCFIDRVRSRLDQGIQLGSQNVFDARGPNHNHPSTNTASITPNMLRAVGCDWVLLGHSDRRNNLGETDKLIADKVRKTLDSGMGVTLTIGELAIQRRWGRALPTLLHQLGVVAKQIKPDEWHRIVVAYEPVWAVGEGAVPCSPKEAQRIHAALRKFIAAKVSPEAAASCRLVYTGSVNEDNAASYAELEDVDGFVVGRAGLDATKLRSIISTLATNGKSEE
jgi:triosephosphate isomerase